MTALKNKQRRLATLNLPKSAVVALIAHAEAIVTCMTDNPYFPSPVPALRVIKQAVTDLETAQAAVLTRTKGTAAVRNEKRTMLGSLLHQLRGYVQVTADADPENAAAIIESAGMTTRTVPKRPRRVFSAKPGAASGEVKLVAPKAANRASYEWEYSTDGGDTWLGMTPTMQASTTLVGLTPGATVMFTYRPVTKCGPGSWHPAITVTVK